MNCLGVGLEMSYILVHVSSEPGMHCGCACIVIMARRGVAGSGSVNRICICDIKDCAPLSIIAPAFALIPVECKGNDRACHMPVRMQSDLFGPAGSEPISTWTHIQFSLPGLTFLKAIPRYSNGLHLFLWMLPTWVV